MTAAVALFGTRKPLTAPLIRRSASSPAVGCASSDGRDQDLVDAEAFCPLPARNLADGVVNLAGLLIGQPLKLGMSLLSQACRVALLLSVGRPLEVLSAVVELVAIDVVDRVTTGWTFTDKGTRHQAMHSDPLRGAISSSGRNLEIAAFEHGSQEPAGVLPNLPPGASVNARGLTLPVNAGRDATHIALIRHFIQTFPIRCWDPVFIWLHTDQGTARRAVV